MKIPLVSKQRKIAIIVIGVLVVIVVAIASSMTNTSDFDKQSKMRIEQKDQDRFNGYEGLTNQQIATIKQMQVKCSSTQTMSDFVRWDCQNTINVQIGKYRNANGYNMTSMISKTILEQKITNVMMESLGENVGVIINGTKNNLIVTALVPAEDQATIKGFVFLNSLHASTTFKNIFSDYQYKDVIKVNIGFEAKFTDKFGVESEKLGFAYGISRTTAEKVKNWYHYQDIDNDALMWYRSISNPINGDEVYVNPIIEHDYYSGN